MARQIKAKISPPTTNSATNTAQDLFERTIEVVVEYCDGVTIYKTTLRSPKVRLTGRTATRGGQIFVEIEYEDYELNEFNAPYKKRLNGALVPLTKVTIIE